MASNQILYRLLARLAPLARSVKARSVGRMESATAISNRTLDSLGGATALTLSWRHRRSRDDAQTEPVFTSYICRACLTTASSSERVFVLRLNVPALFIVNGASAISLLLLLLLLLLPLMLLQHKWQLWYKDDGAYAGRWMCREIRLVSDILWLSSQIKRTENSGVKSDLRTLLFLPLRRLNLGKQNSQIKYQVCSISYG